MCSVILQSGVRFDFSNGAGVQYSLEPGSVYSDVYMQYNSFYNNTQYGIQFTQGSPNLTILDTDVYDNAKTGIYVR